MTPNQLTTDLDSFTISAFPVITGQPAARQAGPPAHRPPFNPALQTPTAPRRGPTTAPPQTPQKRPITDQNSGKIRHQTVSAPSGVQQNGLLTHPNSAQVQLGSRSTPSLTGERHSVEQLREDSPPPNKVRVVAATTTPVFKFAVEYEAMVSQTIGADW